MAIADRRLPGERSIATAYGRESEGRQSRQTIIFQRRGMAVCTVIRERVSSVNSLLSGNFCEIVLSVGQLLANSGD
jgi:hypothetical protein